MLALPGPTNLQVCCEPKPRRLIRTVTVLRLAAMLATPCGAVPSVRSSPHGSLVQASFQGIGRLRSGLETEGGGGGGGGAQLYALCCASTSKDPAKVGPCL